MTETTRTTRVRVWRHDGGRKATEGRLDLASDGSLTFRDPDGEPVWVVQVGDVSAKSPCYSLGASLKVSEPSTAKGV